jgi:hypothetical protein
MSPGTAVLFVPVTSRPDLNTLGQHGPGYYLDTAHLIEPSEFPLRPCPVFLQFQVSPAGRASWRDELMRSAQTKAN